MDDYADEQPKSTDDLPKAPKPAPAELACVFDLEKRTVDPGEGWETWAEAAGPFEFKDGLVAVDRDWYAGIAARCELAVFLGRPDRCVAAAEVAREIALKLGRARPMTFAGPFLDDVDAALDVLAGKVDGVVVEPRPDPEPEIEAERLRRACSCLPERLIVDRGSWKYAPAVMVSGKPDSLSLVPQDVMEFALLFSEPARERRPAGKTLVCADSEDRPWWAVDYFVVGPDVLRWRQWARDPRTTSS